MLAARYLRTKAQDYLDLAERTGGWEASALRALAAECISDAEKFEGARTDAVLTNDDAASQEERKPRRPASDRTSRF
jgi:hypothetical protein